MILGLDYGTKRIGLAIAEEGSKLVLPFGVIENKGRDFVLSELQKIIKDEKVKKIVVGLPISLSGRKSLKTKETQEFIDFLAKNLSLAIATMDERLSSRLAKTLSQGTKGSRDIGAAMVILDSYLPCLLCLLCLICQ